MNKEKPKKKESIEQNHRRRINKLERDLTSVEKQIARIKIVLKDAHLMSLDD